MDKQDTQKRREEVRDGHAAQQLLGNPLWSKTWDGMREAVTARIADPNVGDEDAMEARRMLIILNTLRKEFERAVQTGRLAQQQIDEDSQR